jgi:lipoate-protein ligase A
LTKLEGEITMADDVVYILTMDSILDDGYENVAVSKTFDGLIEQFNEVLEVDFEFERLSDEKIEELRTTNQIEFRDEYDTKYTLDIEKWHI